MDSFQKMRYYSENSLEKVRNKGLFLLLSI